MSLFASSPAFVQVTTQGAASFPWKPVTLISPFTPGSSSDQELRLYQDLLTEQSKYQVIVDFKPGASGIIANSFVAKAAPDGHTLVYGNATPPILTAIRDEILLRARASRSGFVTIDFGESRARIA